MTTRRRRVQLTHPRLVHDETRSYLPWLPRQITGWINANDFVLLDVGSAGRPTARRTAAVVTVGEFFASPGFGGVCAVVAALLVAWSALVVSRQRRVEADRTAADRDRVAALERWWTQYAWLVSADADRLPFEGRVEILVHLLRSAESLQSPSWSPRRGRISVCCGAGSTRVPPYHPHRTVASAVVVGRAGTRRVRAAAAGRRVARLDAAADQPERTARPSQKPRKRTRKRPRR